MEQASEPRERKVYVIVDHVVNSSGNNLRLAPVYRKGWRTSFWKELLPLSEEKSISDAKLDGDTVKINEADCVIINWDASNGDYTCGSDDTLLYFGTRQGDRRDALLKAGGRILCEVQTGMGVPHQPAYDAIFGQGQVQVVRPDYVREWNTETQKWDWELKSWLRYNSTQARVPFPYRHKMSLLKHPIVESFPRIVESKRSTSEKSTLFQGFDEQNHSEHGDRWWQTQDSLYLGWFCNWEKEWVPLLIARPREKWSCLDRCFTLPPAVLLAKCYLGGLMLASTMWIAGSKSQELVNRIVNVEVADVLKTHRRISRYRFIGDALCGPIPVLAWLYLWFFSSRLHVDVPIACVKAYLVAKVQPVGWFFIALLTVLLLLKVWLAQTERLPQAVNLCNFLLFAGIVVFVLAYMACHPTNPEKNELLNQVGWFWGSVLLLRLWVHFVWRRPYGVGICRWAGAGYAWASFWETI